MDKEADSGSVRVAVVGCCHGELDAIYDCVREDEKRTGLKVDILLICGDFQAVRNYIDLEQMAVPHKYRQLNTFYKYYSGEAVAPVLTIFIGGNHEASGHLQGLPYGGWTAPNIYFLGYSGVVQFGGLSIAGISGIYKGYDYEKGHFERPPYNDNTRKSCYHIRNIDVFRLSHLSDDVDIFLSHDWPLGIYHHGDIQYLLRKKPAFCNEIASNTLGNPKMADLLYFLRPTNWFSAHLHCHFTARVVHERDEKGCPTRSTEFCALDKVLPRRRYFQVFSLKPKTSTGQAKKLHYDPAWLAILKRTNQFMSLEPAYCRLPRGPYPVLTTHEVDAIKNIFEQNLEIPENFVHTSPPMFQQCPSGSQDPAVHQRCSGSASELYINPQTELLCQKLGLLHPYKEFISANNSVPSSVPLQKEPDPNEINIDDDDDVEGNDASVCSTSMPVHKEPDPNEINLDDDDEDDNDVASSCCATTNDAVLEIPRSDCPDLSKDISPHENVDRLPESMERSLPETNRFAQDVPTDGPDSTVVEQPNLKKMKVLNSEI